MISSISLSVYADKVRRKLLALISEPCLKLGFLPVPVHFYQPIPDLRDLKARNIWGVLSSLKGIDFRSEFQVSLLQELGHRFSEECQWPINPTNNSEDFYTNNQSFSYGCAASTHCMIRNFKPNLVIEIGSGMSTRVISKALAINGSGKHMIVDPFPSKLIESGLNGKATTIKSRVEMLDPAFFDQLQENDILFIDSGHTVRMGGDVNFLFLDILPRLAPGVIVHIHDICLPYEYPKVYATNKMLRYFWTEQYLLQSFLCYNNQFEVLLAMHYLQESQGEVFSNSFPHSSDAHGACSFWMRKCLTPAQ